MGLGGLGGLGVKWTRSVFLDNEGRPGQLGGYDVQGDTGCVSTLLNAVIL